MKIIFMGSPDFAIPALEKLYNSEHEVICVYTQPPKPANRGMKIRKSKIHEFAELKNLKVHTPKSLKPEEEHKFINNLDADLAVVAAYGLLLPKEILDAPKHGCINIHPSLLPRWRGAAPIHRAVMAGDKQTGCCIMQMDEGLDTGDILLQRTIDIPENATTGQMHDTLANIGAEMTLETLELINQGALNPKEQSEIGVTYAEKISKKESKIDFNQHVETIHNKIRGLNPYPAAFFELDGVKYKILETDFELDDNIKKTSKNGEILNDKFHISCQSGTLVPKIIQKQGKKPLNINEFCNGNKIPVSSIIS